MDILIKGMEMSNNGTLTLVVYPNGDVYLGDVLKDVNIGKAIALPSHGRLGDLDMVEEWMRKKHKEQDCPFNIDAFLFALKKIPTIVEASNGTDN